MKYFLIICFFFLSITLIGATNFDEIWNNFKQTFGKVYSNDEEETARKIIFKENLEETGNSTIIYNIFSDMTFDEFTLKYGVAKKPINSPRRSRRSIGMHREIQTSEKIPDERDYRNLLEPIQFQGDCGCCWAYAAISIVEAHKAIKGKPVGKLSEQELVDCVETEQTSGCNGGSHHEGLDYIHSDGVTLDSEYPRTYDQETCRAATKKVNHKIAGYRVLNPKMRNPEEEMKKIVGIIGPVGATVSIPKSFKNYNSDTVFNDPNCSKSEVYHNLAIVGYGVDKIGGPYWLLRNSWSKKWGNDGYMKIARNKNMCGIADEVVYPLV